ncbi:MAG: hypothetical protein PHV49_06570 [Alistipes sp.]|nr:hypothetical protein [Alistipes sp.]
MKNATMCRKKSFFIRMICLDRCLKYPNGDDLAPHCKVIDRAWSICALKNDSKLQMLNVEKMFRMGLILLQIVVSALQGMDLTRQSEKEPRIEAESP